MFGVFAFKGKGGWSEPVLESEPFRPMSVGYIAYDRGDQDHPQRDSGMHYHEGICKPLYYLHLTTAFPL
ncbi:MAG: hypothetical protein ACPL68_07785, partial [Candidatus Hydrothermia bacterium]